MSETNLGRESKKREREGEERETETTEREQKRERQRDRMCERQRESWVSFHPRLDFLFPPPFFSFWRA